MTNADGRKEEAAVNDAKRKISSIGAFLKTQKHKFVICDTNFVNVPAAR